MPARLNPHHSEDVRKKIQCSVIIDRLQKHLEGKLDLSATQIAAANTLLDRSLAKLSQIQHVGSENGPIQLEAVVKIVGTTETP